MPIQKSKSSRWPDRESSWSESQRAPPQACATALNTGFESLELFADAELDETPDRIAIRKALA